MLYHTHNSCRKHSFLHVFPNSAPNRQNTQASTIPPCHSITPNLSYYKTSQSHLFLSVSTDAINFQLQQTVNLYLIARHIYPQIVQYIHVVRHLFCIAMYIEYVVKLIPTMMNVNNSNSDFSFMKTMLT